MKAIVIHEPKDLRIEERSLIEPGAGQVLLKLAVGGICGSDLHYYNHGGFGTVRLREPMVLGHEVAAFVKATGAGVRDLHKGQLVAVSPSRPCHYCRFCSQGLYNQCLNMRFYGSAMSFPHIQGAFQEKLIVDAMQCVPADGLTPGEAAMAEPLAVTLHATRRIGDMLGKRVLVTGCGPIGILSIIVARRAGAAEIVATDLSDFTLELAKHAGADSVINTARFPEKLEPYGKDKGSFDVLYECSGAASALVSGITALQPRGKVVQLGLCGEMPVPMMMITAKELEIYGSFRFHEEFATGIDLMQKKLVNVMPLITHRFPMMQAVQAFETASDRSRAMKVHLNFNEHHIGG